MTGKTRIRSPLLTIAALILLSAAARSEEPRPIWLAIGRPGLVEALGPLVEHRRAEGFETIVSTESPAKALAAAPRPPAFLLLVGDDEPGQEEAAWSLPAPRRPLYRWRAPQRTHFEADALLGDLDGDLVPDVPVGRLPVRTPGEAAATVRKILAYERWESSSTDLRLIVWGGAPGYGPRLDAMATGLLVSTLRRHAPRWASLWTISASAGQPLCGWPPDHPAAFVAALREGAVLGAVLAHANEDLVLSMRHEDRNVVLTGALARDRLGEGEPTSPLVLLACSSGRFSRGRPGLAETLLALPGGPVAVVAATTESHPLTNYLSGVELLRALQPEPRRIGELWLAVQRAGLEARDPLMETMLKDVEGKLEETIDVVKLRRDQPLMYAILGDPATRLRLPGPLEATVEKSPGGWRWSVTRPAGATRLHVEWRPARWPSTAPAKGEIEAEAARERFHEANGMLAFRPVEERGPDDAWSGETDRRGRLRLVATGPGVLAVAILDLR